MAGSSANPAGTKGTSLASGSSSGAGVARLGSLDACWEEGIWLGRKLGGITHIVAAGPDEALEVRAVLRRPLSERWSREELQAIKVVPWVWRAAGAAGTGDPARGAGLGGAPTPCANP